MRHSRQIRAVVRNGKALIDPTLWRSILSEYEGREVLIDVSLFSGGKTQEQLGYLFGAILPTGARFFGNQTTEELYRVLCAQFLSTTDVDRITGEVVTTVRSVSKLNKHELSEFMQNIIILFGEHGCAVQTPEDYFMSLAGNQTTDLTEGTKNVQR